MDDSTTMTLGDHSFEPGMTLRVSNEFRVRAVTRVDGHVITWRKLSLLGSAWVRMKAWWHA